MHKLDAFYIIIQFFQDRPEQQRVAELLVIVKTHRPVGTGFYGVIDILLPHQIFWPLPQFLAVVKDGLNLIAHGKERRHSRLYLPACLCQNTSKDHQYPLVKYSKGKPLSLIMFLTVLSTTR